MLCAYHCSWHFVVCASLVHRFPLLTSQPELQEFLVFSPVICGNLTSEKRRVHSMGAQQHQTVKIEQIVREYQDILGHLWAFSSLPSHQSYWALAPTRKKRESKLDESKLPSNTLIQHSMTLMYAISVDFPGGFATLHWEVFHPSTGSSSMLQVCGEDDSLCTCPAELEVLSGNHTQVQSEHLL
jgi:hypothetical protein